MPGSTSWERYSIGAPVVVADNHPEGSVISVGPGHLSRLHGWTSRGLKELVTTKTPTRLPLHMIVWGGKSNVLGAEGGVVMREWRN